jgi:sugar/nucleoside kinase (ribokinase family)
MILVTGGLGLISANLIYTLNKKSEVRDLSGAGDTFLSGLVVKYIETNDIAKSIDYANVCASWVVPKRALLLSIKTVFNENS